jgi:hypothetical protein
VPGELDKCITVIDIEQVKMSDVAGESLDFVRKSVAIANQHYPERAHVIFLVNVPSWFSFVWRLVKPLVHEVRSCLPYLCRHFLNPGQI